MTIILKQNLKKKKNIFLFKFCSEMIREIEKKKNYNIICKICQMTKLIWSFTCSRSFMSPTILGYEKQNLYFFKYLLAILFISLKSITL